MHQLFIRKENPAGWHPLLIPQYSPDNYLTQLVSYLFEHRGNIPYILKILNDTTVKGYGGNQMYTTMEGSIIFIYDGYDDDPEESGIRINRTDLIEILEAWQEINKKSIKAITLQRDDEHLSIITEFDNGSEFRRTFNYKP